MTVFRSAHQVFQLVFLMMLAAEWSSAGTITWASSESNAEFGTGQSAHHLQDSRDLTVESDGTVRDFGNFSETWEAFASARGTAGPLTTLTVDFSSAPPVSTYVYDGGDFVMNIRLDNGLTGEVRMGLFQAPILGPMTFVVRENGGGFADVDVSYDLGPGVLDDAIASILGVSSHTLGGRVTDPYLIRGDGDYSTPNRRAGEGAPMVEIDVPEPNSLVLLAVSGFGLFVRVRNRRPFAPKAVGRY